MPFTASTRDVMQTLGVLDAKTLHRRREDYRDKSVHPDSQFFKLGVHYLRKSPTSKQLVWDQEATIRAWVEATKVQLPFRHAQKDFVEAEREIKGHVITGDHS